MNILHVSSFDRGGATAVRRLHYGLLDNGYESDLLTSDIFNHTKRRKHLFELQKAEKLTLKEHLRIKLRLRSPHLFHDQQGIQLHGHKIGYGFTFPENLNDITQHKLYEKADIIHLHWVNKMLDYPSFFAKNAKPIVWTLHDMHPFTGGFFHSIGTDYQAKELINFIKPEKNNLDTLLNKNIKTKIQSIDNQNITVIPTTHEMQNLSTQSQIFRDFPHELIPLGLDTNVFKPYPKSFCRKVFDIPQDTQVLVFVSSDLKNKYKGLPILLEAIKAMEKPPFLLAIGNENHELLELPYIRFTDYISDEKLMALAYSAGDFFVTPSLQEAFGQTTIEAMSCGLPVISFETWGAIDLIDSETGIIVKEMNSRALKEAIEAILSEKIQFDSQKIRNNAVQKYNLDTFVQQHIKIYEQQLH